MKKSLIAALAIVAMVGCTKENSAIEPTVDSTDPVAASFTSASISRVADDTWENGDNIGITMVYSSDSNIVPIDGTDSDTYWNIPYQVSAAGSSGTFSPSSSTTIYFPVAGTSVDFYAYSPYNSANTTAGSVAIDVVTTQVANKIDLIAANVKGKSKSSSTVAFSGDYAFTHKLSKLNLTIKQDDGVADFEDAEGNDKLTTTITNQPNTATYSLLEDEITLGNTTADITAITNVSSTSAATATAILIPTEGTASSTIVFKTTSDSNVYTWDTSNVKFEQGKEHNYEITLTRNGVVLGSSTVNDWGSGIGGNITASDSGTAVASATAAASLSAEADNADAKITVSWTYSTSSDSTIAGVRIYYAADDTPVLSSASFVDITGNSTTSYILGGSAETLSANTTYHIILATYNSAGDETYFPTEVTAETVD